MDPTPASPPLAARQALDLGAERLAREGIESARLDMSLILAEAMGIDRLGLYTNLDRPLTAPEREKARALLARRIKREPMAYILGRREFYGLEFEVTPAVLIPRPETEFVVEEAIRWMKEMAARRTEPLLADIGTGSGAIAVAAAHAIGSSRWIATDQSEAALEVARRNAARHGAAGRIEFRLGDLFEPIREPLDAICSNPPYVAEADRATLAPEVAQWEPAQALFSGPEGLDHLRILIAQAPAHLKPGGLLLLECGQGQAPALAQQIAEDPQFAEPRIIKDHAGIERVVMAATADSAGDYPR